MAGNANSGRRQEKPFRDALRIEALAAERGDPCQAKPGSLRWNARQLLEKGDVQAIKELADRLDGKVAQHLDIETTTRPAAAMSDDELAAIASGSSISADAETVDPSRLN